ncbi:MAG: hypothetical protein LUD72_11380 [Bacteroidales bacterium]|nr:hypothetical protein [Bacteroidales bacterium]
MNMIEMAEKQSEIIRIQSEIIDGLFARLALNVPAEELGSLPELKKIEKVMELRGREE